jgi:hypothetical protein
LASAAAAASALVSGAGSAAVPSYARSTSVGSARGRAGSVGSRISLGSNDDAFELDSVYDDHAARKRPGGYGGREYE